MTHQHDTFDRRIQLGASRRRREDAEALLDRLRGERSPISLERLGQIWNKEDDELKSLIADMIEAGILQEYLRTLENEGLRYSVAELYLSGLGMRRQGQK